MRILITGGASGLGREITLLLAQNKEHEILITVNNSVLKATELSSEHSNISFIKCNYTVQDDLNALFEKVALFKPQVLINNAFTGFQKKKFDKLPIESFQESFEKNISPVISLTQHCIKAFKKEKYGKIITILSSAILNHPPIGWSIYTAEKNYMLSLSKSWSTEYKSYNITSNSISPSFMMTNLNKDMDERVIENMINSHPLKELLPPLEVAKTVQFIIDASQHLNGTNIILNTAENVI